MLQGYKRCLLTPNISELGRIAEAAGVSLDGAMGSQWQQHAQDIAAALAGPVLVAKGPSDLVTDGATSLTCDMHASPKRSGGQGDVLAGDAAD